VSSIYNHDRLYIASSLETETISKAMATFAAINWEEALPTIFRQPKSLPLYIKFQEKLDKTLTIRPKQRPSLALMSVLIRLCPPVPMSPPVSHHPSSISVSVDIELPVRNVIRRRPRCSLIPGLSMCLVDGVHLHA
jgi:hypothetical protein